MSELKARTARSIANEEELLEMGSGESIEQMMVYPKSEADKVITYQKYKRCLAMAERCKDNIDNQVQCDEHDDWLIITEYWERWHKRWLALAEKFKEAK